MAYAKKVPSQLFYSTLGFLRIVSITKETRVLTSWEFHVRNRKGRLPKEAPNPKVYSLFKLHFEGDATVEETAGDLMNRTVKVVEVTAKAVWRILIECVLYTECDCCFALK